MSDDHSHDSILNVAINPDLMKLQGQQPRIAFTGVTARVFALKASINQLQLFCDNYLNFVDDDKDCTGHYFKAALPFVYLQMINYGKMSTESENLGWIAQHEALFSVPVEWYVVDKETGKLQFRDWALVCPFVYVDNDQSLQTGREVFGWTKVRSWLQPVTTSWTTDPRLPRQLLNLRTELFPRLYAGRKQVPRTLIEIIQDAPPSLFRSPVGRNDSYNPVWSIPQAMRQSVGLMQNMMEIMSGLPIFGYQKSRNMPASREMFRKMLSNYRALVPWMSSRSDSLKMAQARSHQSPNSPYVNNLTLKQFRDAEEPTLACYQALVNSRISVENYKDGGLLGGPSVLMGDLTGGYRIKIHDYPEQPIVSTLGLEVAAEEVGGDRERADVLTPVLPFWMACDLRYDLGDTLCWRTKRSSWVREKTHPRHHHEPRGDGASNAYNTTRGAAMQESFGPFHYPDTTMRVFPLMADTVQLKRFVEDYLEKLWIWGRDSTMQGLPDDPRSNCFEPWGSHVYMVVTSYDSQIGKAYTEQNNIGSMSGREIAFWVPIKWYVEGELQTVGFITPYVFCNNMRHVISEREVTGRPAMHSTIESNDDYWLRESGPVADHRKLAKLRTLLMPALNAGQPAQMCDLIEVYQGDVERYNQDIEWAVIKSEFEPYLNANLHAKEKAKDRAASNWDAIKNHFTDAIKESKALNFINLKQYRGTENASSYCFQALVRVTKTIDTLWDIREMPDRMHIAINEYPTMPIVKNLGLQVKTTDSRTDGVVAHLQPIRPFFARLSMTESLGQNLYTRVPGEDWVAGHDDTGAAAGPPNLYTTPSAESSDGEGDYGAESAGVPAWLGELDEPQAVVESLLWDGFGGHDQTSVWRDRKDLKLQKTIEARKHLEFFIPKHSFAEPVNQQVFATNTPDDHDKTDKG